MTDDFAERLENSIGSALGDMLVTKWVALVETIEEDGPRALYIAGSDGLQAWDTQGMLKYALAREDAAVAADLLRDLDD